MAKAHQVLVVEDESDIRELITLHLKRDGYEVRECVDGDEAREALAGGVSYDLLVLDWMLPGISGLDLIRSIRSAGQTQTVPILMVTARTDTTDLVVGLEAGADDYLTKPFEIPVLLARARALIRRSQLKLQTGGARPAVTTSGSGAQIFKLGALMVNADAFEVKCEGTVISLTASEFKLLWTLVQHRGRVLTRDQLIDSVQGVGVTVVDRAIDTHVFGLRKKLGPCAELVETVRGVGYRIRSE